jgi:ATP-binding cassette subfamily B protein
MMSFTQGVVKLLVFGLVCAVGMTVTSLAIPKLVGIGVDRIGAALSEGRPLAEIGLWGLCWGVAGLALLRLVFSFARRLSTNYVGHQVEYRMRGALFGHMLKLSHGFYDKASTGELVSRSINDLRVIRFFVGFGLFQFFLSIIMVVVVSALLFYEDPGLAALVLLPMPLLALAGWRFSSKVHPIFRRVQTRLADVTTSVQENVSGIRVVKSFAREPFERDRFGERAEGVYTETMAARGLRAFYVPGMRFLPAISVALLIFFGGREVIAGTLSLGDFVAFQLYLMQLVWPMAGFGMVIDQAQRALAASERVFEILDSEPEVKSPAQVEARLPAGPIGVEFRDVSFDYDGDQVLSGVNMRAEPGESVAVVGATGSGKSTLLSLVPRFYDPITGSVLVGGVDVRELDLDELRKTVGMVPQETFLFSDVIRNNIAFGNPDATEEEVVRAAKIAGVHDQIMEFPKGYDAMVGEWGITLSGGQKQRVAIARALVKDPRVLILDDATSSVDAETERQIQDALRDTLGGEAASGRTTFIVAHRLSTILLADKVAVLEDGHVTEFGTHEELIERGGRYAEMYGPHGSEQRRSA